MSLNEGQLSPWRKRGGGRDPTVPRPPRTPQMAPASTYARIHTNNYAHPTLLFPVKHRKGVVFLDGGGIYF